MDSVSSPSLKSSHTIRFLKSDFVSLIKRRENAGYAYTCLQVFGQYGTFLLTFLVSCSFSKSNLRGVKKLIVPKEATTTFGINTFQYLAISNWSSLPDETRRAPDLNTFVRMYKAV